MSAVSIPRWVLIAVAALLAVAIFVIVVHPYLDVSNATVGEKIMTRVLGLLATALAAAMLLPTGAAFLTSLPRPQLVKVAKPDCTRRI